jgi:hypothetical protein
MTEMAEASDNKHFDILSIENEVFSTEPLIPLETIYNTEETLNFLNWCNMSISSFKKNKHNKIHIVNKKYNLYQYIL